MFTRRLAFLSLLLLSFACLAAGPSGRLDLLAGVHDGGTARSDKPGDKQENRQVFVGGLQDGAKLRTLFSIDLSAIPDGAHIQSAVLTLTIHSKDRNTSSAVGEATVELHELAETPSHYVTWQGPDSKRTWDSPGGDFAEPVLADADVSPAQANDGQQLTFEGEALLSLVQQSRQKDEPLLNLAVISPQLESQGEEGRRGVLRLHGPNGKFAPMLTVRYQLPDASAEPH